MGLRFRKSIKIAPGIRLNASLSGLSMSLGPRGAKLNISSRGVRSSAGIPGTGLYLTSGSSRSTGRRQPPPSHGTYSIELSLADDGQVRIADTAGLPLPPSVERGFRRDKADDIRDWLEEQCEHWNQGREDLQQLHWTTPDPSLPPTIVPGPFSEPPPLRPRRKEPGLLTRLLPKRRRDFEDRQQRDLQHFERLQREWEDRRKGHEEEQAKLEALEAQARLGDEDSQRDVLERRFATLEWPRETLVSFEVADVGRSVWLDVDLPEIEDLPTQEATVAKRGFRLNVKDLSEAERRRRYATHIHAVLFRLVGEVFAVLPTVDRVVASGYSQRPDKATGHVEDQYLVSASVPREAWERINFYGLSAIDVVAAFDAFEIRRRMSKTGVFAPVEPWHVGAFGGPPDPR